MKVGLHDSDGTGFPNLALMKLSAYHKSKGDSVQMVFPLLVNYDRIYSSKVFTFTKPDPYMPNIDCEVYEGGTGYHQNNPHNEQPVLSDHMEHIMPDYSLYGIDYSMGFLTRGCIRKCDDCFVPDKEGGIRANADIEEFLSHREVVLMDNNVLASPHGIDQIKKITKLGLKVDFNQGLDARLIDDTVAKVLSQLKWREPLRLACDHKNQIESVRKAVELLRWHNTTPTRYSCYVLVKDIDDALERVRFLKGMGVDPFCQPFRDKEGTEPTAEQIHFARWCNVKSNFKSCTWEDYKWK